MKNEMRGENGNGIEPKEKMYRVWFKLIDIGFIEVLAENEEEAEQLADKELFKGDFQTINSWSFSGERPTEEV